MDRGRRITARVLVALGLVVASLALSAWWAQAAATRESPVLTSLALHSVESAVVGQLQAQAGPAWRRRHAKRPWAPSTAHPYARPWPVAIPVPPSRLRW
jgi:hypothetical protein